MKEAQRPLYEERITADPRILAGKPMVRGTRIAVSLVLEELAQNPDINELLAAHPDLTRTDVQACLAYANTARRGLELATISRIFPIAYLSGLSTPKAATMADAIYIPTLGIRPTLYSLPTALLSTFSNIFVLCSGKVPLWANEHQKDHRVHIIEDVRTIADYEAFLNLRSSNNPSKLASKDYDLPFKRNLAISHAKKHRFRHIGLLDDDILVTERDLSYALFLLQSNWDLVGLHVLSYPDVSTIDHIERYLTKRPSKVSLGGNCIFLKVDAIASFFPYSYNEDWFFLITQQKSSKIAAIGTAEQRIHKPWTDHTRVHFEQFGDILASGIKQNARSRRPLLSGSLMFWDDVIIRYVDRLRRLCSNAQLVQDGPFSDALNVAEEAARTISPRDIIDFVEAYQNERSGAYEIQGAY